MSFIYIREWMVLKITTQIKWLQICILPGGFGTTIILVHQGEGLYLQVKLLPLYAYDVILSPLSIVVG